MFFNGFIQRRLASLLQPWLIDEPDLELKLGFLRSNGTVKNLNFNTSALNQSLDDSSRYRFKQVTVEELSLRVSYWSFPAFVLRVHGLRITLSLGEVEGGGARRKRKPRDTSVEDKKKLIAEIDPEGSALHDAISMIADITARSWRNNIVTSFLRHCQLQMDEIHVLLLPPSSYDSVSCLLDIKEAGAESKCIQQTCFLGGVISSCFMPSQKCSFDLDVRDITIGLQSENRVSCVASPTDIFVSFKLENLQFTNSILYLPALKFSFTPADLFIISLFCSFPNKDSQHTRTGRQLWRIAVSRISSLIPIPKLSWYRVISSVKLWLYYLHIYEKLLLQVGYPVGDVVKKSATKMLADKIYSRSVRHHWDVICECEEMLSAEAIAQARKITRCRAADTAQVRKPNCEAPQVKNLLWKIYQLLALIWAITCHVLHSILRLLYLLRVLGRWSNQPKLDEHFKSDSDDSFPKSILCLNMGEFSISFSPEKEVLPSVSGLTPSALRFSYDDLSSFHISFDAFFLRYLQNILHHHLMFASGCIKVVASSLREDGSDHGNNRLRERQNKKITKSQDILWCEPAQSVNKIKRHGNDTAGSSIPLLELLLGKLWLNWKNASSNFEGNECKVPEAPCILFERKCFLIDQSAKNPSSGFCKWVMVVGRLNFTLGNSSVLSLAVLYGQIQQVLWMVGQTKGTNDVLQTSASSEDLLVVNSNSKYKTDSGRIETKVLKMIPPTNVQVGMMIAGPRIRLSLKNKRFSVENADLYPIRKNDELELSFDLEDIEFVVSPNLLSDSAAVFDEASSSLRLEKPKNIDIPKPINEIYSCQGCVSLDACLKVGGLKAYLGEGHPLYQIIMLSPTTVRASSLRKDFHALGSTMVAFSTALHWIAPGFTAIVFLDELSVLVKVVFSLYYDMSHALGFFGSNRHRSCENLSRQEEASACSHSQEMFENRRRQITSVSMNTTIFCFKNICELESLDIVLHNSRKSHITEDHMIQGRQLAIDTVLDYGIHISVQLTCGRFSFEDGIAELVIDLSGVQSVLVRDLTEIAVRFDQSELRNLLLSLKCLFEASLSHCKFTLNLGTSEKFLPSAHQNIADPSTSTDESCMLENPIMVMKTDGSRDHSCCWLSTRISLGEIYLADCAVKNILVKKNKSDALNASFSVGEQFKTVFCQSQGGSIFLQTEAVLMFVQCSTLYRHLIGDIWHSVPSPDRGMVAQYGETTVAPDNKPAQDFQQLPKAKWDQVEAIDINVSKFTLTLVDGDEFGRLQELLFEANVHLSVEVRNMQRKVSFEISKFSILSQFLHETAEQQAKEIQVLGDPSVIAEHGNTRQPFLQDSSFMTSSLPQDEPYADNLKDSCRDFTGSTNLHSSPQNYILKGLCAVIAVEWPMKRDGSGPLHLNQLWVGKGSISGLDMNLSLTELQIILSVVESVSGVRSEQKTSNLAQRRWSMNQESEGSLHDKIPDGSIVAIEDVYQHTYITVEDAESGYNLSGTIHYSLVGERALFRVKHQNAGRWKPRVQFFSLISLYAKDASGEPLRLNGRPRSDFVDVSGTTDNAWAIWSILPYGLQSHDGNSDWDSYGLPMKNSFYLVNNKNDRSVAFIDGVLEFVSKPGNPFKWKVFCDLPQSGNNLYLDNCSMGATGTAVETDSRINDNRELSNGEKLRGVTIEIDKAMLTIFHELSDTMEKFPLLQGSISSTEIIVQMANTKARFMSRLEIMLHYFDAQRNLWRELVNPLEICTFYRYRFLIQGSENTVSGVPGHFHARIKELNISLSELSLDILLFMIGKLKLAGPFAVRSSVILANCCKVENKSGLTLLCQFFDSQHVLIGGRQSSTFFLRHLALANRPPEASFFSIQLADKGTLATSLIHLSLSEARAFACRTRVVPSRESRTFPGPFIVVEVSQRTEDGLSIIVSPLLRIKNETDFSMELRFQRPQKKETEFASLVLEAGESVDDSMATFGGVSLSGGVKKALMSLSVGNFLFSFRPKVTDALLNSKVSSVEWSDDLRGGKLVPLSGIFEKLSYQVRTALAVESVKCALGTAHCILRSEDGRIANIYFLIQSIGKDVPVIQPDNLGYVSANKNLPIALQEQKEISLLPTVHVSNLLETEIYVDLTDADAQAKVDYDNMCSQATIPCGSAVNLYANPANIFFTITLTAFDSRCKPVNSSQWVKKLQKQKTSAHHLDIELDFGGGKYFATLRLSRGHRGILEAAVYTSYTLANDTQLSLYCFADNHKPLSRDEVEKHGSGFLPELGAYLPPKSRKSWFIKNHKLRVKMVEEHASEALLNLDALSGLTEIDLEVEEKAGVRSVTKLGIALKASSNKVVPSQLVSMNPRHIVLNESEEVICVRQCYLEDDMQGIIAIDSKQRTALKLQKGPMKKGETTIFEKLLRKHSKTLDDSRLFIQFQPNDASCGWSGPVCIASLGQFFLKFRRSSKDPVSQSDCMTSGNPNSCKFAAVHVVEEDSSLVLHFHRPPNADLPYRIENCLRDAPITYYQKDSLEPETLGSGSSVDFVWDDLSLPRKLVVQIDDVHLLWEISLDKVRAWKPFNRAKQQRGMGFHFPLDMKPGEKNRNGYGQVIGTGTVKLGYEVYAEGLTRVLRICEFSDSHKGDKMFYSSSKMRFRISYFALQLLEYAKKDKDVGEASSYSPIIITRLDNIDIHSMFTDQHKVNRITVQSLSVDQKLVGAPFATVLRKHQPQYNDTDDSMLQVVLVILSSNSKVTYIKYLSIILQPLDLNLDEETLMRIVPFWRKSLSDPNAPSRQYYFDHFEIHPVKIVASFLPGDAYSSYTSTQEMLRSLLHSVIKIPTIKNTTVELNGVLVTHALITLRELSVKCAQHYSWYALRAIYIAKGSPLLPPAFASIFDDFASSSLDVFFDPSSGLINLPGLTMGTFKLISKCIDGKGFSGTKRYFGDLGKTLKVAGSNILFAAVTEVSDSVLKGAETNGLNGMMRGFHQGILKLAMEPSLLGSAFMEGGPDRKIKLDRTPGVDELYIEGYLQALLDALYNQEYLRVRVIDNQVILKNLPPNSSLINEIVERVKGFLVSKGLLKGDSSTVSHSSRHIRGESEWRIGPTVLTLCEHLFVSFAIRILRKQAGKVIARVNLKERTESNNEKAVVPISSGVEQKAKLVWRWGIGKFVLSGIVAYIDGRLCRCIPNPIARRVVSGFLLSFLHTDEKE
ncbi:hypothetical protein ACH5RR_011374 [Cinchona calisaya]|uniref:Vacuolar protein sorting-associated protein 13 VPS13 adaptor binding domain-containing protein n=1 Tax=Cinchona calisaya TaxID=153742 RepID=A0ABD3A678_9GENT